jgi:hypothetical protein
MSRDCLITIAALAVLLIRDTNGETFNPTGKFTFTFNPTGKFTHMQNRVDLCYIEMTSHIQIRVDLCYTEMKTHIQSRVDLYYTEMRFCMWVGISV